MVLASAGRALLWEDWDDIYIVFQPSSAETHVFNETTALMLRALDHGPLSAEELKSRTEAALRVHQGGMEDGDFAFAVRRLDELGLIDMLDDGIAA